LPRAAQAATAYNRSVTFYRLILASASPRRRQLLQQLGVAFEVLPSNVNEDPLPGEAPLETQHRITREKARAAMTASAESRVPSPEQSSSDPDASHTGFGTSDSSPTVIAADTTVLLDGEMLNKPADEAEAWAMLRRLRGRTHVVQSCIVVAHADGREDAGIVSSAVVLRDYSDDEIAAYIASGDPFDKAGSYAVQHPAFQPVAEIRGCPLNVIGLALCHVRAWLPELPASERVCAAWFGRACPERLSDPGHAVSGQNINLKNQGAYP
jgi:septum formation protein